MLNRRDALKIGFSGALAWALPVRGDDAKPGSTLYFSAQMKVGGEKLSGVFAVDPENSSWRTFLSDANVSSGQVSPDGRTFAFIPFDPEPGLMTCDALTGANRKRIVDGFTGKVFWSAGGKSLIVSGTADRRARPIKPESFRISPDGTERKALRFGQDEMIDSVSPDGNFFLTQTAGPRDGDKPLTSVYKVTRADGTEGRDILKGETNRSLFFLRFTPDSQSLVYKQDTGKEVALWTVDLDGKNRRKIVPEGETGAPGDICWSRNGKRMSLAIDGTMLLPSGKRRQGTNPQKIEIADADGTNRRTLAIPEGGFVRLLDWY